MHRRTFLAASAATLSSIAGCLSGADSPSGPKHGDDLPSDDDPDDGYPPAFDSTPDERSIDTDAYETTDVEGTAVPLAPIEDTYYWYATGNARFADARSETAYGNAHVYGAVLSPAAESRRSEDDPVGDWPTDDRIVCYCGCPHHLSSMRAAQLIEDGYENVYVIDEGFREWNDRDYPMAGSDTTRMPDRWVVAGEVSPAAAGGVAWGHHDPTGQMESTDIAPDGSYELHLGFYDVAADSPIRIETPEYTVEGTLAELSSGTIEG
ncbi:rhodanese-like domain-containing protein [Halorussus marinus]|uniref:rhodanese-like domain-containing protein n=1 Tax=Halorussus marinus TaxID=2505976 RepID=UPI00106EB450|nr:rhodanese-like domain-containing protein [Halorussus marinus]